MDHHHHVSEPDPSGLPPARSSAFTLVEVLIVVVILGILAAVVTALFGTTTRDASVNSTFTELQKVRRHVEVYEAREGTNPPITNVPGDPDASWGPLVGNAGEYLMMAPVNSYVGGPNRRQVILRATPDAAFPVGVPAYGWIYDPVRGEIFAAGFDANDQPLPRP